MLVRNGDVVTTLLKSLPSSNEYLITALKMMFTKEFTTEYVIACMIHVRKMKGRDLEDDNKAIIMSASPLKCLWMETLNF